MKQLSSFAMVTLLAVTLSFAACTSETTIAVADEETESTTTEQTSSEITLSFSFGTSSASRAVGKAVARDDDDTSTTTEELQTAEEKQVTRLIAVIFNNPTQGTVGSDYTVEEDDGSTYFSYCDIIGGSSSETELDEEKQYEISFLANSGAYYELCFVANPSETMEACITGEDSAEDALTSESTIADFKALVETQDPGTKPMTMVSTAFYGVTMSDDDDSPDLGTVHLQRIMSRIDIINLGDGITVTKAVLYNRTSSSVLISDAQSSGSTTDYLQTDGETFDFTEDGSEGLVGSSYQTAGISADEYSALESTTYTVTDEDGNSTTYDYVVNASKATIYSYEQYEDSSIPYIELYYTVSGGSSTYVHTVNFVTTSDDTTDEEPLYFNRNYCYRIFLDYNPADALTVSITVEDWDEDVEIEVSQSNISSHIGEVYPEDLEAETPSYGDFLLYDGVIADADKVAQYYYYVYGNTGKTLKDYIVGIVFYLEDETSTSGSAKVASRDDTDEETTSRMGDTISELVANNGFKVHGKAMALFDSQESLGAHSTVKYGLTAYESCSAAREDFDGYYNTQLVLNGSAINTTIDCYLFPSEYESQVPTPSGTTGWYLPAAGEWWDLVENLGNVDLSAYYSASDRTSGSVRTMTAASEGAYENIEAALAKVGEGNYHTFYTYYHSNYYPAAYISSTYGTAGYNNVGIFVRSATDRLAPNTTTFTRYWGSGYVRPFVAF